MILDAKKAKEKGERNKPHAFRQKSIAMAVSESGTKVDI